MMLFNKRALIIYTLFLFISQIQGENITGQENVLNIIFNYLMHKILF